MKKIFKKNQGKRGQMQMQETILVIFIFTVMMLVGFVIFYRYTLTSISNDNIRAGLVRFYNMIGYFPDLPEVKCTELGAESECIDAIKLLSFRDVKKNFGFMNITVFVIYPPQTNVIECTNSVDNCNMFKVYYSRPLNILATYRTSTPVSLYYPGTKEYKIGKMVLETYVEGQQ